MGCMCRRDCIGQSLAKITAMTTLARLYGSFSFKLSEDMGGPEGVRANEHLNLGIISPANGLRVHAVPRVSPSPSASQQSATIQQTSVSA